MKYEQLNAKILEQAEEMLSSIRQNMRIDSVKGPAQPGAPYGAGPKAALEDVLALGERLGFRTGNVDDRVGWIEYGEGEEMVGVLGHLDVVPAGDGWTCPPFGAEVHDGVLWGRGCLDDKGPTIGAVYALKAIRDLQLPIDRRIRVLFGTDEECGSSCVRYYVENGYELPAIGFTPDGEYPVIFFEKGMSNFVAGAKIYEKGDIEVESFCGGTAANVVTPTCRLVVKGPLAVTPTEGVTVTEEDGRTIVEATGVSAHGSTPQLGVNAAIKLLGAVKENSFGGDFQHLVDFILQKLGTQTNGEALGICFRDEETGETTVNLGVVQCDGTNMQFTLDIRYPKNADPEVVDDRVLNELTGYNFDVLQKKNLSPLYVPKDSELIRKLTRVYREQTGEDLEPLAIGGGTYAKEFPNMAAFGPMFPGSPECIHQPDERVEIKELIRSVQITAAAMYELAQKS